MPVRIRTEWHLARGVDLTHSLRPAEVAREFAAPAPGEAPELREGDLIGVQSPIGLDAPAQVRAAPGAKPVTTRETPQDADHYLLVTYLSWRRAWRSSRCACARLDYPKPWR